MRTARAILTACTAIALAACGPGGGPTPPPSAGSRLYVNNCLACHLANGQGVPGVQPPLAGTPVPRGDPGELLGWVMFGARPAALPRGQYSGAMPQFAYLSDDELAALLSYVRSSFGNQAGPITPAMVAAARAAHRDR
jgi:mono/diheme cytochrome c family protein